MSKFILLENSTFVGFADVLGLQGNASGHLFPPPPPREGKTYRVGPSPRLAGVPWNVGAWVQEPVCQGSCRKGQVSTKKS